MLGFKEIRDAVERIIVDQDRAQQALFRLDVVRCAAVGRIWRVGRELEYVRISRGHGSIGSSDLVVIGIDRSGGDKAPIAVAVKARTRLMHDSHMTSCESYPTA